MINDKIKRAQIPNFSLIIIFIAKNVEPCCFYCCCCYLQLQIPRYFCKLFNNIIKVLITIYIF